jgi:hypothetical protein
MGGLGGWIARGEGEAIWKGGEGRGVEGLKQRLFSSTPVLRLQFSGQSPTRVCCRSLCFCIAPSNNNVFSGGIHTKSYPVSIHETGFFAPFNAQL